METLVEFVNERARKSPEPYRHWYIDGGRADPTCGVKEGITVTSIQRAGTRCVEGA